MSIIYNNDPMTREEIKVMLSAPKAIEIGEKELELHVFGIVLKAYKLTAMSVSMTKETASEQASIIAKEITKAIRSERPLKSIRLPEIDYSILCGIKGAFADVRHTRISFQTIYLWLNAYVDTPERIDAVNEFVRISNTRQIGPSSTITEREKEDIIRHNINLAYQEYLSRGATKASPANSVGEILARGSGKADDIRDLGGGIRNYLIRLGVMQKEVSLLQFFEELKSKGERQVFKF